MGSTTTIATARGTIFRRILCKSNDLIHVKQSKMQPPPVKTDCDDVAVDLSFTKRQMPPVVDDAAFFEVT